jgi:hypothetical protein
LWLGFLFLYFLFDSPSLRFSTWLSFNTITKIIILRDFTCILLKWKIININRVHWVSQLFFNYSLVWLFLCHHGLWSLNGLYRVIVHSDWRIIVCINQVLRSRLNNLRKCFFFNAFCSTDFSYSLFLSQRISIILIIWMNTRKTTLEWLTWWHFCKSYYN